MRQYLLIPCLFILALHAGPILAQSNRTVTDSVKIDVRVVSWTHPDFPTCGSSILATWPDVKGRVLDQETGFGSYFLKATEGEWINVWLRDVRDFPGIPNVVPEGSFGFVVAGGSGDNRKCSEFRATAELISSGAQTILNGRPFRMVDWYALFNLPTGTPVARFTWEQSGPLDIDFDGSFASDLSHEVEIPVNIDVAEYAWDFGDGKTSSQSRLTHAYAEPGSYQVSLTVTDDDGETNTRTKTVVVAGVVLAYSAELDSETTTFTEGEEFTLRTTVTNEGTQNAVEVRIPKEFWFAQTYPDGPFKRVQKAKLEQAGDTDEVVTSLAVGASTTVDVTFLIERTSLQSFGQRIWTAVTAEMTANLFGDISGENANGDPATVKDNCEETDDGEDGDGSGCNNVFKIQPVLTSLLVIEPKTAKLADDFKVRLEITNNGDADVTGIRITKEPPVYKVDFPTFVAPEKSSPPEFTVVTGPEPNQLDMLSAGETDTVEYMMRVDELASWLTPDGTTQSVPSTIYMQSSLIKATYKGKPVTGGCGSGRCGDSLEVGGEGLFYSIHVSNPDPEVDEEFDLVLTVSNEGTSAVTAITATVERDTTSEGDAELLSGPVPTSIAVLGAGESSDIVYRYQASEAGLLRLDITISGEKEGGGKIEASGRCLLPPGKIGTVAENCTDEITINDGIIVNDTRDLDDEDDSDDVCDADLLEPGNQCTLRAALQVANEDGGGTITFKIKDEPSIFIDGESGPLPPFKTKIILDGTTQTGGFVELIGPNSIFDEVDTVKAFIVGIEIASGGGGSEVRGMAIHSFSLAGIRVDEGANTTLIEGNRIGTDITGTIAMGGGAPSCNILWIDGPGFIACLDGPREAGAGLHLMSSNNRVRGNVISGNGLLTSNWFWGAVQILIDVPANGNLITGNRIGYDSQGALLLTPVSRNGDNSHYNTRCPDDSSIGCWGPIGISVFGRGNVIGGSPDNANIIGGHWIDVFLRDSSGESLDHLGSDVPSRDNVVSYNKIGISAAILDPPTFYGGVTQGGESNEVSFNEISAARDALRMHGPNQKALSNTLKGWIGTPPEFRPFFATSIGHGALAIGDATGAEIKNNTITSGGWGVSFDIGSDITLLDNQIQGDLGGILVPPIGESEGDGRNHLEGTLIARNSIRSEGEGIFIVSGNEIHVADNDIDVGETGVTLPLNEFGGATQSVMLTGNRIKASAGIDLGETGVTYNDLTDFDTGPNGLLNFPIAVQAVRAGASGLGVSGRLEGASTGEEYRIDFFVSEICAENMFRSAFNYGPGEVYLGKKLVTPSLSDFFEPGFIFVTSGLQEGSQVEERHRVLSMTATREDLYATSEFSICVPISYPDDVAEANVEPDQVGLVIAAQDVTVAVEGATEVVSKSLSGSGGAHAGGRVYVSRYPVAPDTSVFAQLAATAPDGSLITPEAVAPLYWLLGETGLTAVADDDTPPTFEVCLALSDAIKSEHRNRVVLMYRSAATEGAWMPLDTVPDEYDGEPYLCSGGLTGLGEFSFGGSAEAFKPGTSVGVEVEKEIPESFVLSPNYPNPFNPQTTIGYGIPETAHVRITVFDALGRQIALLVDRVQSAGHHQTVFDAHNLPSGIYRYQFVAGSFVQTREMILLK